jgi:triphosphoribosyl-dephospho-CoA synthase
VENAVIYCHLKFMARHPDSLIVRKRGMKEAQETSRLAKEVLAAGWPRTRQGQTAFAAFDAWLRAIRNQRNPGTTADLVAASLFAALREGIMKLPSPYPWSK